MIRSRSPHLSALCEPEVLLPSQLATPGHQGHRAELDLVAAMLEDAIRCVLRNATVARGPKRRQFVEACNWFLDDRREWPFAFVNVCDLLGLDAGAVRHNLRRFLRLRDGCVDATGGDAHTSSPGVPASELLARMSLLDTGRTTSGRAAR